MIIRNLKPEDATRMLEWMQDESVVRYMGASFGSKTLQDCESFIRASAGTSGDVHMAVADDDGRYMGSVSLKHINVDERSAEFAIVVHQDAMGKGYSKYGMKKIIEYGFEELHLQKIYWCVSSENARAVAFYDKNGYRRVSEVPASWTRYYNREQQDLFYWYIVENV